MNIHWNPNTRTGKYGAPNRGIKSYRTGAGRRLIKPGTYRAGYSKTAQKYK